MGSRMPNPEWQTEVDVPKSNAGNKYSVRL